MIEYMTAIRNNPNQPIPLTYPLPQIEKLGARLNASLTPINFTVAKLYAPRKAWGNNRNRSNYEARWLANFAQRLERAGGRNNKIQMAIGGLGGGARPTASQNTGGQSRAVGQGQGQVNATMNNATSRFNPTAYLQSVVNSSNDNFGRVYGEFMRDHSNLKANLMAKLTNAGARTKLNYIGFQNRAAVGGRRGR
jgi:hypothetical protein